MDWRKKVRTKKVLFHCVPDWNSDWNPDWSSGTPGGYYHLTKTNGYQQSSKNGYASLAHTAHTHAITAIACAYLKGVQNVPVAYRQHQERLAKRENGASLNEKRKKFVLWTIDQVRKSLGFFCFLFYSTTRSVCLWRWKSLNWRVRWKIRRETVLKFCLRFRYPKSR